MKNLLCRFGFHDWEEIQCLNAGDIEALIINKTRGATEKPDPRPVYTSQSKYYYKKVCLRCGKKVDEINTRISEVREQKEVTRKRTKEALALFPAEKYEIGQPSMDRPLRKWS